MFCTVITIVTAIWQFINYWNAEDVTAISYKTFHTAKIDVYPRIGLCFANTVIEEKLSQYAIKNQPGSYWRTTSMKERYSWFLAGEDWNPDMLQIDHDDVTKNIEDYVLAYEIGTTKWKTLKIYNKETQINSHNSEIQTQKRIDKRKHRIPHFRELSLFSNLKCFSFDIPFQKGHKITGTRVRFNTSIFNEGVRPRRARNFITGDVLLYVPHYLNQLISKLLQGKRNWPVRNKNMAKHYITEFEMSGIEIHQQRNKFKEPCIEDMNNDDKQILQEIAKLVGCKPPYWNSSLQLTNCLKQEEFLKAYDVQADTVEDVRSMKLTHKLSCRGLEKIHFDVEDFEIEDKTLDPAAIEFKFSFMEFSYKEVKNVRSMDLQSLIGRIHLPFLLQAKLNIILFDKKLSFANIFFCF